MTSFFMGLGSGAIPWWMIMIVAVGAYFLGNINPAILIGRAKGVDIRAQGSGNAGATNVLRSLGKKAGALTFAIDVVKGWAGYYIPVLVFMFVAAEGTSAVKDVASLCGICVVLGHMYPAIFGFRGGKGVATVLGVLLAASWLYALILLAVVVIFTAIFWRVSLSVMIAVAVALVLAFAPFGAHIAGVDQLWIVVLLALVVWKHRSNIKRLIKGEEPKLSFGSGKKKAEVEQVDKTEEINTVEEKDKEAKGKEMKGEEE